MSQDLMHSTTRIVMCGDCFLTRGSWRLRGRSLALAFWQRNNDRSACHSPDTERCVQEAHHKHTASSVVQTFCLQLGLGARVTSTFLAHAMTWHTAAGVAWVHCHGITRGHVCK